MHSTRTLLLAVVIFGVLMFVTGHFLWENDAVDNSEETPTPTVSASPTTSTLPSGSPMSYTVRLTASGPIPATLTIKAGDSVSLVGEDAQGFSPRSTTCVGFDAMRSLAPGERYTVTFTERRTCTYYDSRQSATTARQGTIIVR